MRYVFFIVALIFSFRLFSQPHYTIKYGAGYIDSNGYFIEKGMFHVLVIERNESYEFRASHGNRKIEQPLGSKFRTHAVYNDVARGFSFFQTHLSGYPKYLVEDTLRKINWRYEPEMKLVVGYKCKMATANVDGDDILVYYSEELPKGFGPFNLTGLPGTILEIHSTGLPYVISVHEVIKGGYTLQKPQDGKLISVEEYQKILSKVYKNSRRNPGTARKVKEYKSPNPMPIKVIRPQ